LFKSFVFECIRQGEEKKVPKYVGNNPIEWKKFKTGVMFLERFMG
jgi:hypothetical protein